MKECKVKLYSLKKMVFRNVIIAVHLKWLSLVKQLITKNITLNYIALGIRLVISDACHPFKIPVCGFVNSGIVACLWSCK